MFEVYPVLESLLYIVKKVIKINYLIFLGKIRFNLSIDKGHSKSLTTFVHNSVDSPDVFFVDVTVIYINYLLAVYCLWLQLATISLWLQEIH